MPFFGAYSSFHQSEISKSIPPIQPVEIVIFLKFETKPCTIKDSLWIRYIFSYWNVTLGSVDQKIFISIRHVNTTLQLHLVENCSIGFYWLLVGPKGWWPRAMQPWASSPKHVKCIFKRKKSGTIGLTKGFHWLNQFRRRWFFFQ
jgi:hypothetical protein